MQNTLELNVVVRNFEKIKILKVHWVYDIGAPLLISLGIYPCSACFIAIIFFYIIRFQYDKNK